MIRRGRARELADGVFTLVLALLPAMRHGAGVGVPRTHGLAAAVVHIHWPDEVGGSVCFFLECFAGTAAAEDEENE